MISDLTQNLISQPYNLFRCEDLATEVFRRYFLKKIARRVQNMEKYKKRVLKHPNSSI